MMGIEGRLGGDLFPGTNPFIFLLRYSAARVTADNRHEQRSHGRMSGSDIVNIHSSKLSTSSNSTAHVCKPKETFMLTLQCHLLDPEIV